MTCATIPGDLLVLSSMLSESVVRQHFSVPMINTATTNSVQGPIAAAININSSARFLSLIHIYMEKRVSMLEEVVADLAAYYPDLKQLGETIAPLKEKVASIQSARAANAEIMGIRDALLK